MWKEVKDDRVKYEETTELKRKGQIRKSKQISYWSTFNPNILNKTASEPSSEDLPKRGQKSGKKWLRNM